MNRKAVSGIMLALLSMVIFTTTFDVGQCVTTIGIGMYWDNNCIEPVVSVDWGNVEPGLGENISVFVRNEGNVNVTLSLATSNWNPPEAAGLVTLTWNYSGEILEESHVIPVTISLCVSPAIEEISVLTFDANVYATNGGTHKCISLPMFAFISTTWTVDDDGPADFSSIQEAINSPIVKDGDTIFVYNGTYYEHLTISKRLKLIGQNRSTTIIDGNATGAVVVVTAGNVSITGFTIRGSGVGPSIGGIVSIAKFCFIHQNILMKNTQYGILLRTEENVIHGNIITDNGVGVGLYGVTTPCIGNILTRNSIENNELAGISANAYIYGNSFTENTIRNNGKGISLHYRCHGNFIYHNNFINNTYQAYTYESYNNTWDYGYPSGGNYWSDYEETYPDAEEIDDSGIWNVPYWIDENNQDNYPLMEPYSPIPTTVDELKTEIEELGSEDKISNQGIVTSLIAKLNVAQKLVDNGKTDQAKKILNAFINEVQAQSGKHITPEAADILIESAEYILSHL